MIIEQNEKFVRLYLSQIFFHTGNSGAVNSELQLWE